MLVISSGFSSDSAIGAAGAVGVGVDEDVGLA